MVRDAEVNKEKDEMAKKVVSERNQLEQLAYGTKAQLNDDKLKGKFTDGEKRKIEDVADKVLRFLDGEPNANLDQLKEKTQEFNSVVHPIMQRIHAQGQGFDGMRRGQENGSTEFAQ